MSFRDNLLHLRSSHNMTQEQLAMLLGVSRQSVTKWEAGQTTPEMEKLLQLCQIFGCTLDELVQGDLTARAADPTKIMPAQAAPADVCGYEEHSLMFARKIPTGVLAILLGVAGLLFVQWLAEPNPSTLLDSLSIAVLFVGITVGLAFIIPACTENTAFAKAHPYIEDFYTPEEKAKARSRSVVEIVAGIGLVFLGVVVGTSGDSTAYELLAVSGLMALVAVGTWFIVHGALYGGRTNLDERNKDAAGDIEPEDILRATVSDEVKQQLLAENKRSSKHGTICGIIMLVATVIGLFWLFAQPVHFGINFGRIFWVAWVLGGISCPIACMIYNLLSENK